MVEALSYEPVFITTDELFSLIQPILFGKKESDNLGGEEKDDWTKEKRDHYSNKGGHKERSDANKEKRKEEQKKK